MEGVVPARSRQVINGVVRPHRRVYYQFAVSYELLMPECTYCRKEVLVLLLDDNHVSLKLETFVTVDI